MFNLRCYKQTMTNLPNAHQINLSRGNAACRFVQSSACRLPRDQRCMILELSRKRRVS